MNSNKTQLSSVVLNDSKSVWTDDGNKSFAYFCKDNPSKVDKKLISELKDNLNKIGDRNLRLCLHDGPDAPFHAMIILERKGKYYRPHRHMDKGETFHIIEGKMGIFSFNDNGDIVDACVLEPGGNFIYKVKANMHHAVMAISDVIIYHESKPGPFTGEGDSIYPSWAPDQSDPQLVEKYVVYLEKALEDSLG